MSNDTTQPDGTDREYESALEALKENRIIDITPIEGGFQVRECCAKHFMVSLTPEQLRGLGQEIISLADSAVAPPEEAQAAADDGTVDENLPAAMKGKTITISPGIWQMRMTEEFQARLVRLEKAENPKEPAKEPAPTKNLKPWIKP